MLADRMYRIARTAPLRYARPLPSIGDAHQQALSLWLRAMIARQPGLLHALAGQVAAQGDESPLARMLDVTAPGHEDAHQAFPFLATQHLGMPHVPQPDDEGEYDWTHPGGVLGDLSRTLLGYLERQQRGGYHPLNLAYVAGQPGDVQGNEAAAHMGNMFNVLSPTEGIDPFAFTQGMGSVRHRAQGMELLRPVLERGHLGGLAHLLYLRARHGRGQEMLTRLLQRNAETRDEHAHFMGEHLGGMFDDLDHLHPRDQYFGH